MFVHMYMHTDVAVAIVLDVRTLQCTYIDTSLCIYTYIHMYT